MAFEVPPLPYDYAALEPHIDEATMRVHHDKHHQAYVDNANKALEGTGHEDSTVEQVLAVLDTFPEDKQAAIRNNAGGHANHTLFWEIIGPDGGGEPFGTLGDAINDVWGSFGDLKSAINDNGVRRDLLDRQPGLTVAERRLPDPRDRRLGARLLPELPEPAPGLPRGVVERRQLGRGRRALPASARRDGT
jgi:hypothetical protein